MSEMWLLSGSGGRHNMRRLPEGTEEGCKNPCGTCTYPGKEARTAVKPCNDLTNHQGFTIHTFRIKSTSIVADTTKKNKHNGGTS